MKNRIEDLGLRAQGETVLRRLAEAEVEIHRLEKFCTGGAVRHCLEVIEGVAVDIAAIATGGGEWDDMARIMRACGMAVPEALDDDMRRLCAGDDSALH